MTKTKKILLFASIGLLSLGAIGTGVGLAYAGYQRSIIVKDLQTSTPISPAGSGIRKRDIYLNLNGYWSETANAKFFVRIWLYSDNTKFEWQEGTKKGDNYMFQIDNYSYDRIRFARTAPSFEPNAFNDIGDGDYIWQRTGDITITTSYTGANTVKITSFGSGVTTDASSVWESVS